MRLKRWLLAGVAATVAGAGALLVPVPAKSAASVPGTRAAGLDLSGFSGDRPAAPLRLLFIHHSCGGQLLAPPGPRDEHESCIYRAAENGGGLRDLLSAEGYEVHEASYDSAIGGKTDLFDWAPKFTGRMDAILRLDHQDLAYEDDRTNRIVAFKSCYPNNRFLAEGDAPGRKEGPDLTVWNARAALTALLPAFAARPDTLFVYVTAPPVAPIGDDVPLFRWLARKVRGRPVGAEAVARQGELARAFNNWVVSPEGWLADYPGKNVVVFDYFGILTGETSNLSAYPTGDGRDSHPSREGNAKAAAVFVPFLNRAVRRAGLAP